MLLTVFGAEDAFPWRAVILLGAALGALLGGRLAGRRASTASLELPTLVVALVTAAAGSLQAVRYGWGLDSIQWPATTVMVPVLGLSLASAILATGAGWRLRRVTSSRLILAPALLLLLAGPWTANRPDAMPILTLWILTALLLGGMLVTTVIARRRTTSLPPVWLWFVLAWITAVVGWSMRELRVEAFSLPLGLALLACGVLGFTAAAGVPSDDTAADAAHRTATTWPLGFRGSWQTLAPGMIVLLLPSVLATATDPLTWRAVLVIAVALAAILVGSSRKLAALFILGLVVLPIENVIVFVVQIGHSIGALPWWITLATAGAVLLVLAVSSERKTSGVRSTAALLRDLR
ncbi:SCO7613 C-terminal domain-containing membrane protein [Leifsonia poae]|uniref:SCO7613 C-terminal domain-containing membrane protein n=1 Tax=Leifsonia poae TaxID=110933 RepID=UPI003D66BFA5